MIQSKQDYKFYLYQDKIANGIKDNKSIVEILKNIVFPNPTWSFIKLLRKVEYNNNCKSLLTGGVYLLVLKMLLRKKSVKLGFSIPINSCGYGLSLPHYGNIVINPLCKIGNYCRIHVGVNIGASGGKNNVPTIGNNVYIGPGVKIFGKIEITDNITIGANAVVNKSFNIPNTILAGIPAQIVRENNPNWIESFK